MLREKLEFLLVSLAVGAIRVGRGLTISRPVVMLGQISRGLPVLGVAARMTSYQGKPVDENVILLSVDGTSACLFVTIARASGDVEALPFSSVKLSLKVSPLSVPANLMPGAFPHA